MKPKAVIFDFDGTIADSAKIFLESLQVVIGRKQEFTYEEAETLSNLSTKDIIRKLGIKKWQLPLVVLRGRSEISKRMDRVEPFSGMPELLKNLAAKEVKVFILSTNTRQNVRDFLIKHNLEDCVSEIYADIGIFGKVKWMKKLMKQNGLGVEDCVYIGDETRDVDASKKAGIKCIAVEWGYSSPGILKTYGPFATAKTPKELARLLEA